MQRRVNARGHAPGGDDGGDVGGALITVLRVYYLVYPDVSDIRWQFSADVTLTHAWPTANSVPQLEVSADGVAWFSPDNVYQLGPAVFLGSYSVLRHGDLLAAAVGT